MPASSSAAEYSVRVNGRALVVHEARVSAVPFNQLWPGYQRPLAQTEVAYFACWEITDPVEVEVVPRRTVERVVIRPRSRQIAPVVHGNRIFFTLNRPGPVTVEINGTHHALHLFADAPEDRVPGPNDLGVIYFGPGVHEAGVIRPTSGQTVYLAPGAVVYGAVEANSATNIQVLGRGILDGGHIGRTKERVKHFTSEDPFGAVTFCDCQNIVISGIVTRDPNLYNVSLIGCRNVRISNLKAIGSWRYNSDGIDLMNSQDVRVEHCFVRSFDDSLVATGWAAYRAFPCGELPCRDVVFRDCVVWNDWGRALEIGATCCAPEIKNVEFTDCDIIHATHIALDIQNDGRALVQDIRFKNIRCEMDDGAPEPLIQKGPNDAFLENFNWSPRLCVAEIKKSMWSDDEERGQIRDVVFEDITAAGDREPPSKLVGCDAAHTIDNVRFKNVVINGRPVVDAASCFLKIGKHVGDVHFG